MCGGSDASGDVALVCLKPIWCFISLECGCVGCLLFAGAQKKCTFPVLFVGRSWLPFTDYIHMRPLSIA